MSNSSDNSSAKILSSPSALLLAKNQQKILETWVLAVKSRISSAKDLRSPIIVNTLPVFLGNLAEALDARLGRDSAIADNNVAEAHGGERARVTDYRPDQVVEEYVILRTIVLDVLSDGCELSSREVSIIHSSFDEAIRQSMIAFYVVLNSMRASVLSHLTHDIRTPLTSAKLSLSLIERALSRTPSNPEQVARHSRIALKNIDYANDLIEQMLDEDHFRTEEKAVVPQFDRVDMMEVASSCISEMNSIGDNRFELSGESVQGYWNAKALRRVLENLIANAVKYGDEGTPITVKISSSNGRMFFSVHNRGPSIPAEKRGLIFNYQRLHNDKEKIKGWGFGLPYCQKIAEQHAGSIAVESSDENGTTFTVDIPVDPRGIEIKTIS